MATAIETSSQPKSPITPTGLFAASVVGAVYVIAALAVVFFALPLAWERTIEPVLGGLGFVNVALRVVVQLAAALGLIWFGNSLAGENPPKGIRGGIFLVISFACAIFFLTRAIGLSIETSSIGLYVTVALGAVMLFFAVRFLSGERGKRWMEGIEESGWLHTNYYKKALGQKVRRLTQLGIAMIAGTGLAALSYHGVLPDTWSIRMPFTETTVTLLHNCKTTIPVIIGLGAIWFAWRAVNVPTFGEFLIATEAEMNKVSWSTRKQLTQDTIVVLITTIFMALFLLVVDLFWGWLLSNSYIGVLPGKSTNQDKGGKTQELKY